MVYWKDVLSNAGRVVLSLITEYKLRFIRIFWCRVTANCNTMGQGPSMPQTNAMGNRNAAMTALLQYMPRMSQ